MRLYTKDEIPCVNTLRKVFPEARKCANFLGKYSGSTTLVCDEDTDYLLYYHTDLFARREDILMILKNKELCAKAGIIIPTPPEGLTLDDLWGLNSCSYGYSERWYYTWNYFGHIVNDEIQMERQKIFMEIYEDEL